MFSQSNNKFRLNLDNLQIELRSNNYKNIKVFSSELENAFINGNISGDEFSYFKRELYTLLRCYVPKSMLLSNMLFI